MSASGEAGEKVSKDATIYFPGVTNISNFLFLFFFWLNNSVDQTISQTAARNFDHLRAPGKIHFLILFSPLRRARRCRLTGASCQGGVITHSVSHSLLCLVSRLFLSEQTLNAKVLPPLRHTADVKTKHTERILAGDQTSLLSASSAIPAHPHYPRKMLRIAFKA